MAASEEEVSVAQATHARCLSFSLWAADENTPGEPLVVYRNTAMETHVRMLGMYAGLARTVNGVTRRASFSARGAIPCLSILPGGE